MRTAAFSLLLATGQAFVAPVYAAGIAADPAAPQHQQPTVVQTANGLPQINIRTPSSAGVSMNQYRQFDVDGKGAVLNNSRRHTPTRLGGWVRGNPWLARGEAKVIVNQVNSAAPSHLNGHIEVAGRRAEVIMANPAGIRVNGGGFINAAGVTLTTGRPLLDNGALNGFRVREGRIAVSGGGLDTSGADYTRILARAAEINAGVWAQDLQVASGSHDLAADGAVRPVSDRLNPTPAVAIDTGALGGMYADRITLISTDKGAAVRNAGQIFSAAGGVSLSADGRIGNSGTIAASDKGRTGAAVTVDAAALANSGTLSAQGRMSVQTDELDNSGWLGSANELSIRSQNLTNSGAAEAARFDIRTGRLNNSGLLSQTGLQGLALDTNRTSNRGLIGFAAQSNGGGTTGPAASPPTTAAGSGAVHTAGGGHPVSEPLMLPEGSIGVSDSLDNRGGITAGGGIGLTTRAGLTNPGRLHLDKLAALGGRLDNRGGEITARRADIRTQASDNRRNRVITPRQPKRRQPPRAVAIGREPDRLGTEYR